MKVPHIWQTDPDHVSFPLLYYFGSLELWIESLYLSGPEFCFSPLQYILSDSTVCSLISSATFGA